jgi:hypothetical protein
MGSGLLFFAANWRGLFFLGFELCFLVSKPAAITLRIDPTLQAIFIGGGTGVWAGSQISGFIDSSMRNVRR